MAIGQLPVFGFLVSKLFGALSAAAPAVVAVSARWESGVWFAFCPGQQRDVQSFSRL